MRTPSRRCGQPAQPEEWERLAPWARLVCWAPVYCRPGSRTDRLGRRSAPAERCLPRAPPGSRQSRHRRQGPASQKPGWPALRPVPVPARRRTRRGPPRLAPPSWAEARVSGAPRIRQRRIRRTRPPRGDRRRSPCRHRQWHSSCRCRTRRSGRHRCPGQSPSCPCPGTCCGWRAPCGVRRGSDPRPRAARPAHAHGCEY